MSEGSPCIPQRALPTETKVESGTSQSKSETSVNFSNSGLFWGPGALKPETEPERIIFRALVDEGKP